jgi:hypothetical protein
MPIRKFMALLVFSVAAGPGLALASGDTELRFLNTDDQPRSVEYRIGNFRDCQKNTQYVGTATVPPNGQWTIKIKDENTCCLRVAGTTRWNVNAIGRQRKYDFKIN